MIKGLWWRIIQEQKEKINVEEEQSGGEWKISRGTLRRERKWKTRDLREVEWGLG